MITIWRRNMHGYLSINMISSERETVSPEGQIIPRTNIRAYFGVERRLSCLLSLKKIFYNFQRTENVNEHLVVCCVECVIFSALWYDFVNKQTSPLAAIPKRYFILNSIMNKRFHSSTCMVWKNGEYHDHAMHLDQSRVRKALIEVTVLEWLSHLNSTR